MEEEGPVAVGLVDPQPHAQDTPPSRAKRCRQSPFELAVLKHLSQAKPVDDDVEGDKNFLLSFLPMMKNMTAEKKMTARMAIRPIAQAMHQVVTDTNNPHSITPFFQPPQYHLLPNLPNSQPPALQSQHNMFSFSKSANNAPSVPNHSYNFQNTHYEPQTNQHSLSAAGLPSPTLSDVSEVYSVMGDDTELTNL